MTIKNIFFDVGNTLLFQNRQRTLAPLHERGIFPTADQLRDMEKRTKLEFDAEVDGKGKVDHGFWHIFYSNLLAELGVADEGLQTALVNTIRISANWCEIREGTREVLDRLASRYRIAVISNSDGRIANVLGKCGIANCFLTITDSGIVGHEKPHPAIFNAALHGIQATAAESLYVGDIYSVDYLGATKAGMQAVLFDVPGAYEHKGLPRVASLEELETRLGNGRLV